MLSSDSKGKRWNQVQSLRDVSGDNFSNGQIRFNFSIPAQESWNPYYSYFKLKYKLNSMSIDGATATRVGGVLGVGLSQYFAESLWQSIDIRINGIVVNKVDDYVHQVATLRKRLGCKLKNNCWDEFNMSQMLLTDRLALLGGAGIDKTYRGPTSLEFIRGGNVPVATGITVAETVAGSNIYNVQTAVGVGLGEACRVGDALGIKAGARMVAGIITAITGVNSVQIRMEPGEANINNIASNTGNILLMSQLFAGIGSRDSIVRSNLLQSEIIWKPEMGFFDMDRWLPGGDYEFVLTPHVRSQLLVNALEAVNSTGSGDISIIDMEFNVCSSQQSSDVSQIEFIETRCQAATINTASLSQKQFNIAKNTHAITVAYQDNRVMSRTDLTAAKFKISDPTNYPEGYDLALRRMYVQYDGSTLPNPIPDIRYNFGLEEFIQQRWYESSMMNMTLKNCIETYQEYKIMGPYYHFQWPRKNKDATEIQVNQEFSSVNLPANVKPQLLIFSHYAQKYSFTKFQGYITGVKKMV